MNVSCSINHMTQANVLNVPLETTTKLMISKETFLTRTSCPPSGMFEYRPESTDDAIYSFMNSVARHHDDDEGSVPLEVTPQVNYQHEIGKCHEFCILCFIHDTCNDIS